jgi:hypothetical protein
MMKDLVEIRQQAQKACEEDREHREKLRVGHAIAAQPLAKILGLAHMAQPCAATHPISAGVLKLFDGRRYFQHQTLRLSASP